MEGSDTSKKVVGYFALICPDGVDYTYVLHNWADKSIQFNQILDTCFIHAVEWTKQVGRSHFRGETARNADAYNRRWGVKEHSIIMRFDVADLPKLLQKRKRAAERMVSSTWEALDQAVPQP